MAVKENHPKKNGREEVALRRPFSFPKLSGSREKTVNQTVQQTQKVAAYFRRSVV
jgi:hypothetical protein